MRKFYTVIILVLFAFLADSAFAGLSKGGEITWKCVGNGYVFTVTVYRDCDVTSSYSVEGQYLESWGIPVEIPGFPGNRFPLQLISIQDITPQCAYKPGGPLQLKGCELGGIPIVGDRGSVQKITFRTDTILMNNVPAPPPGGYTFYYSGACCRSSSANTSCSEMVLRAKMYPYYPSDESNPLPLSECYDNSPYFAESPVSIYIKNPKEISTNHLHFDSDCDSLVYSFDYPWESLNNNCPFIPPYNPADPFPGITSSLNRMDGSLGFKPITAGDYTYCVRIDAYKCNQRIASVYKDFLFSVSQDLVNNEENNPPLIKPPFSNGTSWDTTIYAHEMLEFTISAQDTDTHMYNLGTPSQLELILLGDIFGQGYTNPSSGCENPPCAIISNSSSADPSPYYTNNEQTGFGYTYSGNGEIKVKWNADCNNKCKGDCPGTGSTHSIIVKARDTDCPVPAQETRLIRIKVLNTRSKYETKVNDEMDVVFTTNIIGASSYFWYFGDGTTSNVQNPIHHYKKSGSYMTCLMVWDSCYNNDMACKVIHVHSPDGIGSASFGNVVLYPNPVSTDLLTIEGNMRDINYKVCDMLGKTQAVTQTLSEDQKLILDIGNLSPGCYFLHLENERGQLVRSFIRTGIN